MKSKKWIDSTCAADLNQMICLAGFLSELGISSADDMACTCDEILSDDFCGTCEAHKDDCDCGSGDGGGRYMREYDDGADYED